MKIGIDISQIVYDGTGVASYTKHLVRSLLRLKSKHQFVLFGASLRHKNKLEAFANSLKSENLRFEKVFLSLPPSFTSLIWNQIHHVKIEKIIGKIDVFHSSDWSEPPSKAAKVTTIHDLVVYRHPESSSARWTFDIRSIAPRPSIVETQKQKLKWVKKETKEIIAVSVSTKKDIVEFLGIDSGKISVIDEAADEQFEKFRTLSQKRKQDEADKVSKKYKLGKDYILLLGTQQPRKNLQRFIEAFELASLKNTQLVIAGKFGWGPNLFSKNKHKNIKVLGLVAQADLPGLYFGARFFGFPSIYEGFGLPVLEAMCCGTPVLCSNKSSLPEVGGKAVIYTNPENVAEMSRKIVAMMNLSRKLRTQLVNKGYKQSQKFSWKKAAVETLRIYEKAYVGKD